MPWWSWCSTGSPQASPTHLAQDGFPPAGPSWPWRSFALGIYYAAQQVSADRRSASRDCSFLGSGPCSPPVSPTLPRAGPQLMSPTQYCRVKNHHVHFTHTIPLFMQITAHDWRVMSYYFPERQHRVVAKTIGPRGQPGLCCLLCAPGQVTQLSCASVSLICKRG